MDALNSALAVCQLLSAGAGTLIMIGAILFSIGGRRRDEMKRGGARRTI
ncbi:hypothetical protein [Actinocorallia lasiicapitis]